MKPSDQDALFRLFGAASDGTISEADAAQLQQRLAASATARKLWFLFQDMDLGLDEWAASRQRQEFPAPATPPTRISPKKLVPLRRKSLLPRLAIAAAITAAGITLWSASTGISKQPLAMLDRGISIQWTSPPLPAGTRLLSPQSLDLTSGIVELTMSSGALVVFEGPGRMDILSENSVHLHSGRLHATVPPAARGFTVTGNGFSAIDHGTRFGCAVTDARPAEIHVFEGEVELKPARQASRWMQTSQALAIHTSSLETIPPRPELFISPRDLDTLANDPKALRSRASLILKNHPATILHLDAADTSGITQHQTTLTAGRDPNRKALAFDGISSRLTLQLDHQSPTLTLLAWIRCEDSRRRQDFISAAGPLSSGAIAWYRHQSGSLGFGTYQPVHNMPGRGWRTIHSATLPASLSDWSMLAVVADSRTGTITHFLNGKVVSMGEISLPSGFRLGSLIIGATSLDPDLPSLVHHFHGSLDEIAIIAAPLTHAEISRLYQFGRPNP